MSKEATIPEGRRRLAAVVREAGDIVQIADAERALDVSRTVAAKLLSRWSGQGWLRRVGPGAYAPVSLDSLVSEQVLDDPWVLVPVLYDPAYIGGRTAAEHWDLTEQIFRDIVVMTERPVRAGSQERHGASFTLRHVRAGMMFGTRSVWRGRTRIAVSDVHRTIIDMLDDPEVGAGIQHVDDCLASYFGRKDRDDGKLVAYADRIGNGAIFKRLGFLAERRSGSSALLDACRKRLTQGNAKLDPALGAPSTGLPAPIDPPEIGDRLEVWRQTPQQPDHFEITLALSLQPAARTYPIEIAVYVELQQVRRIVAGTTCRLRRGALETSGRQVQTIHEGVDETDRVIPAHVIVHCFRQKQNLRAVNARNVSHGGP